MKKQTIKLIVVLVAISLTGLILTQLYWVRNAVQIAEKQYDNRVSLVLNEVMSELEQLNNQGHLQRYKLIKECDNTLVSVVEFLNTDLIDSILSSKFDEYNLDTTFIYGIINTKNDSIWSSSTGFQRVNNRITRHKICLSCLYNTQDFDLEVYFPNQRKHILLSMSVWLIVSILFLIIVIGSFSYILFAIFKQKKNSEIRNDFINNMTHEFKTPISTISIASEMIYNDKTTNANIHKYSKVIFDENHRLKNQVERVLQMAIYDRREIKLNISEFDLHLLLKETIDIMCLNNCDDSVSFKFQLFAGKSQIRADKTHIENIIVNLIENSIKYSKNDLQIIISSKNVANGIILKFIDNGIGMKKEVLKHIFDKFYRANTGNVHNVRGFGLGLNYVKTLVRAHMGTVKVKSEYKKGSRFEIFLPFNEID